MNDIDLVCSQRQTHKKKSMVESAKFQSPSSDGLELAESRLRQFDATYLVALLTQ